MALSDRRGSYSRRAYLLALFTALAMLLGGGGSPNPVTELLLELVFVLIALVWLWRPGDSARTPPTDRLTLALAAVLLVVPLIQLVPLPPSLWGTLPGRENELDALALVGAKSNWRPISMSPSHTLASLLAIVPPVFCLVAASQLEPRERRPVMLAIVVMAVATCLLGAVQLTAGGNGINLYREHHVGWITGFQANRNATADVLLIGLLALAVLAAPYLGPTRKKLPLGLSRASFAVLVGGIALLLLGAVVMTGSRAGIALVVIAGPMTFMIVALERGRERPRTFAPVVLAVLTLAALGILVALAVLSRDTAVSRVAARFSDMDVSRLAIWQDSWFALKQYWPVGFGMGGFEDAMLPAERLEYLAPSTPNRAHNDFLEIGLEAGLLGYVMLAAGISLCILMAWKAWRRAPLARTQVMFGATVLLLIGLHSIVDYPLRSMAVACLAGLAGGMMVAKTASDHRSTERDDADKLRGLA